MGEEEVESYFYAEWVFFDGPDEKEEALLYLSMWKKYLLRSMYGFKQKGGDQIIERPPSISNIYSTLGIKIEVIKENT